MEIWIHRLKVVGVSVVMMGLLGCSSGWTGGVDLGYPIDVELSEVEIEQILDQAVEAASNEQSLVRVDAQGEPQTTRMHVIIVNRRGEVVGRRSMHDAWPGSVDIAQAKAFTAVAFSSDANALTTRSIGQLSQPGGPLWQIGNSNPQYGIIEFPGGVPLYRGDRLVGAIGVSGDGVEQDENVAEAGADGFMPPKAIRIDTVTDGAVPYVQ